MEQGRGKIAKGGRARAESKRRKGEGRERMEEGRGQRAKGGRARADSKRRGILQRITCTTSMA
eukprot:141912-Chlamydomonas_euryale.AAC.11